MRKFLQENFLIKMANSQTNMRDLLSSISFRPFFQHESCYPVTYVNEFIFQFFIIEKPSE